MLIIVGPSASGKTELVKKLVQISNLKKIVTYTTRPMRYEEKNGIDYNFVTTDEFKEKLNNNFFFEYVSYNDNYYGTGINDITDDKVVILEPTGLKHYIDKMRDKIKICYLECSEEKRYMRMISRKDEPSIIQKRIKNDKMYFNEDIKKYANWIIDSEKSSVDEIALTVLKLYKEAINEN